jgi:hypothetical protein
MSASNQENSRIVADNFVLLMYPSGTMKNSLVSLVNLLTLLVGVGIGLLLAPHVEKPVQAVGSGSAADGGQTANQSSSPEYINGVNLGGPAVGTYLLLTHHIQTDELVVNGLDILKLNQGELNLLSRIPGVTAGDMQTVVNDAKNVHLYRFGTDPKAATVPPAKP